MFTRGTRVLARQLSLQVSVFVNQRGRICMRVFGDILKAKKHVRALQVGDWIEMAIDLEPLGRTGTSPKSDSILDPWGRGSSSVLKPKQGPPDFETHPIHCLVFCPREDDGSQAPQRSVPYFTPFFWSGGGVSYQNRLQEKADTLILTSLLEDLDNEGFRWLN